LKKHSNKLIENLLNEIEFYENLGFHRIADDFTKQLIRYSASFEDVAQGVGGDYWKNAEIIYNIQRIMAMFIGIPECAEFTHVSAGGSPTMFQSESDFRKQMQDKWIKENPGKPLNADALKQIDEMVKTQNIIDGGRSILDADPTKYKKCIDAATEAGLGEEAKQFFNSIV
jgi:hypothetical protein